MHSRTQPTPLVSVLMTVYNREKYLASAIESVLAQTMTDLELIIVDDGSTDRSLEIARSYSKDPRVKLFVNEHNLGDYPNRNRAASLATGKYLKYVDSDDAILPICLEVMSHMMERHPEAGILYWSSEGEPWYPFVLTPLEVYRRGFFEGKLFSHSPLSLMIRKDVFDNTGGFDISRKLGADTEFCYRIARYYPVLYGPFGLVFYRVHEGQIVATASDSSFRHRNEQFHILLAALRHPECPLPPEEQVWQVARLIYGALRFAAELVFKQGRWATAWNFLRSLGISPREFMPLFMKRPTPPTMELPDGPDWSDFPCNVIQHHRDEKSACQASIVIAPEGADANLRVCLESVRHQLLTDLEVLVALDDSQGDLQHVMTGFDDSRFKCVNVPRNATLWERYNHVAKCARGEFLKFIGGSRLTLLYPYALGYECALLGRFPDRKLLTSGAQLGFHLGPMVLAPREALSLDLGAGGMVLRTKTACCLFRRDVFLAAKGFDEGHGSWAVTDLCYRLAVASGAILGPYGMCTAFRMEPKPTGRLPARIQENIEQQCIAAWGSPGTRTWVEQLSAETPSIRRKLEDEAQWHSSTWLPRFLAEDPN